MRVNSVDKAKVSCGWHTWANVAEGGGKEREESI